MRRSMVRTMCVVLMASVALAGCGEDGDSRDGGTTSQDRGTTDGGRIARDSGDAPRDSGDVPRDLAVYRNTLEGDGIDTTGFTIFTQGDFAFWWDSRFDISAEVPAFIEQVELGTGFEGEDVAGEALAFSYLAYPYSENLAANRVNLFHEMLHVFQGARYAGSTVAELIVSQPGVPENSAVVGPAWT